MASTIDPAALAALGREARGVVVVNDSISNA
jgi:hypothetical protein